MISFFDVHAHYTDKRFSEYGFDVDFILRDCFSTNVYRIVNSGTNPENSKQAVEMAKRYPGMCASVGIHPTDAFFIEDCDYALEQIEHLILQERYEIAAIGEIGLDYYHEDMLNKSKQKYFFDALLSLSEKHRLPVVIRCREAMGDCLDIVRLHPNSYGVFHCYAGSAETAKELIKRNYFISVCGNVTYKKSDKLENVIRTVGADCDIDFAIGDDPDHMEHRRITKPTVVRVPPTVWHCPIQFRKVNKPVMFQAAFMHGTWGTITRNEGGSGHGFFASKYTYEYMGDNVRYCRYNDKKRCNICGACFGNIEIKED